MNFYIFHSQWNDWEMWCFSLLEAFNQKPWSWIKIPEPVRYAAGLMFKKSGWTNIWVSFLFRFSRWKKELLFSSAAAAGQSLMKAVLNWTRLITCLHAAVPNAGGLYPGHFPTAPTAGILYDSKNYSWFWFFMRKSPNSSVFSIGTISGSYPFIF